MIIIVTINKKTYEDMKNVGVRKFWKMKSDKEKLYDILTGNVPVVNLFDLIKLVNQNFPDYELRYKEFEREVVIKKFNNGKVIFPICIIHDDELVQYLKDEILSEWFTNEMRSKKLKVIFL